jgi:glucose/arabinose dehydrogenase
MARTIRPPVLVRDHKLLVLLVLAAVTTGLAVLAESDVPVAQATPTSDGYALVQDVNTANVAGMVDFALIPGRPDEAVVLTQGGMLWRVSLTGAFARTEFGNLTGLSRTGGEEGVLSLAFSPNFATDSRVYVYSTPTAARCAPITRCARISRFPVVSNDMIETSETVVLDIDQEIAQSNHNGGRLLFGPDGYLYLSIGDGGGGGDPNETGQDHTDLIGSVLRIHVTGQTTPPYTVPADNPFVGVVGDDLVWAYGFRNPWRYSFDRVSGDLWLGDVGQGSWEEVDKVVAGGNYGWDCYEGNAVFETAGCSSPPTPFIFPRAVYSLSGAPCAVVGGYVYRGTLLPEIYGWFIYSDNCSGQIWAVNPADNSEPVQLFDSPYNVSSLAELPNGELLVLTFQNAIYRLTCVATPDTDSDGQPDVCDRDDDNDGFSDAIESYVGTSLLLDCGTNAWPADINNDTLSDISDVVLLAANFGDAVPPAPVRQNIAPDPPDGFVDITDITRMAGLFGMGCGP